jgi:hypothetical protein
MLKQYTQARPALPQFFAVAGRLLCLDALDEWSARAAARHFRDWYLTPAPPARPDASIRIRRGSPPAIPRGLESFPIYDGNLCFTDGRAYHLDIQGSRVLLDPRGGVEVWVNERVAASSPAVAQTVFSAFSGAMRRCGLFELHSAAVVEPASGRAALLAGASGSGKTTLTLRLAAAGWGYLSDDVLLLSEAGGRAAARPLRRVFAATETTAAAVGLQGHAARRLTPASPKLRFAPQTFFPGGFVESSFPRALFFLSVTREPETRVSEMSRPEAMVRLLRMCPWACYDRPASAEYLRVLSLVAGQCRAYELRAGTDLLADPARAASLLAAYVGR